MYPAKLVQKLGQNKKHSQENKTDRKFTINSKVTAEAYSSGRKKMNPRMMSKEVVNMSVDINNV